MIVCRMVLVCWLQYHTYSPNIQVNVYRGQLLSHYKIYMYGSTGTCTYSLTSLKFRIVLQKVDRLVTETFELDRYTHAEWYSTSLLFWLQNLHLHTCNAQLYQNILLYSLQSSTLSFSNEIPRDIYSCLSTDD